MFTWDLRARVYWHRNALTDTGNMSAAKPMHFGATQPIFHDMHPVSLGRESPLYGWMLLILREGQRNWCPGLEGHPTRATALLKPCYPTSVLQSSSTGSPGAPAGPSPDLLIWNLHPNKLSRELVWRVKLERLYFKINFWDTGSGGGGVAIS